MSLFLSAFGFYVSNAVTMYSVQMAAFLFALLAVSNLLTTYASAAATPHPGRQPAASARHLPRHS